MQAELPTIENYGPDGYQSSGKPKATVVTVGKLEIWFSYHTPVAFRFIGENRVVRENTWGPTIGKHINWIDGGSKEAKEARIHSDKFEQFLAEAVQAIRSARAADLN